MVHSQNPQHPATLADTYKQISFMVTDVYKVLHFPLLGLRHIAFSDNNDIINDQLRVAEIFNDYFSTVAMSMGFVDCVKSATEAINKHCFHPSLLKIQGNRKATGYDNLPGKIIRIAYLELSCP